MSAPEGSVRIALDHVGIAVESLEEAGRLYAKLFGRPLSPPEDVEGEGVRVAFLEVAGARIELLEPLGAKSAVGRFLASGRRGVHHLSFRVEGIDLKSFHDALVEAGVEIAPGGIRKGSGGTQIFFVHPRSAAGVLIEFSGPSSHKESS